MKYSIVLKSRYTGESIYLGATYKTINEAQKEVDKICNKCNVASINHVHDNAIWQNKNAGFLIVDINAE